MDESTVLLAIERLTAKVDLVLAENKALKEPFIFVGHFDSKNPFPGRRKVAWADRNFWRFGFDMGPDDKDKKQNMIYEVDSYVAVTNELSVPNGDTRAVTPWFKEKPIKIVLVKVDHLRTFDPNAWYCNSYIK